MCRGLAAAPLVVGVEERGCLCLAAGQQVAPGAAPGMSPREQRVTAVSGQPVEQAMAASVLAGLEGDANDVYRAQAGVLAASVEWDVEPRHAQERLEHLAESPDL